MLCGCRIFFILLKFYFHHYDNTYCFSLLYTGGFDILHGTLFSSKRAQAQIFCQSRITERGQLSFRQISSKVCIPSPANCFVFGLGGEGSKSVSSGPVCVRSSEVPQLTVQLFIKKYYYDSRIKRIDFGVFRNQPQTILNHQNQISVVWCGE